MESSTSNNLAFAPGNTTLLVLLLATILAGVWLFFMAHVDWWIILTTLAIFFVVALIFGQIVNRPGYGQCCSC